MRRLLIGLSASASWRTSTATGAALTMKKTCASAPGSLDHLHARLDAWEVPEAGRERLLERLQARMPRTAPVDPVLGTAGRIERDTVVTEDGVKIAVDRRFDEVRRRGPDERRHEQVDRLAVQGLRLVRVADQTIPHHGDPLAQRHRLRLVVHHVHQ